MKRENEQEFEEKMLDRYAVVNFSALFVHGNGKVTKVGKRILEMRRNEGKYVFARKNTSGGGAWSLVAISDDMTSSLREKHINHLIDNGYRLVIGKQRET